MGEVGLDLPWKWLHVQIPLGCVKTAFVTQGMGIREFVKTVEMTIFFLIPIFFWNLSPEEIASFLAALWLNIFFDPYFFFDPQFFLILIIIFWSPTHLVKRIAKLTILIPTELVRLESQSRVKKAWCKQILQLVFCMWQVRVPAHFDVTAYVWLPWISFRCQINDKSAEQCQATVILPLSPARTGVLFNAFCFLFIQFGVKDYELHFWFVSKINWFIVILYMHIIQHIHVPFRNYSGGFFVQPTARLEFSQHVSPLPFLEWSALWTLHQAHVDSRLFVPLELGDVVPRLSCAVVVLIPQRNMSETCPHWHIALCLPQWSSGSAVSNFSSICRAGFCSGITLLIERMARLNFLHLAFPACMYLLKWCHKTNRNCLARALHLAVSCHLGGLWKQAVHDFTLNHGIEVDAEGFKAGKGRVGSKAILRSLWNACWPWKPHKGHLLGWYTEPHVTTKSPCLCAQHVHAWTVQVFEGGRYSLILWISEKCLSGIQMKDLWPCKEVFSQHHVTRLKHGSYTKYTKLHWTSCNCKYLPANRDVGRPENVQWRGFVHIALCDEFCFELIFWCPMDRCSTYCTRAKTCENVRVQTALVLFALKMYRVACSFEEFIRLKPSNLSSPSLGVRFLLLNIVCSIIAYNL